MKNYFRSLNKHSNSGFTLLESAVASLVLAALALCLLVFASGFIKAAETGKLTAQNANLMMLAAEALRKSVSRVKPPYWQGSFRAEIHEASVSLNFTDGEPETVTLIQNIDSGIELQSGDKVMRFSDCSFTAKPIVSGNFLLGVEFLLKLPKAREVRVPTAFGSIPMGKYHAEE